MLLDKFRHLGGQNILVKRSVRVHERDRAEIATAHAAVSTISISLSSPCFFSSASNASRVAKLPLLVQPVPVQTKT